MSHLKTFRRTFSESNLKKIYAEKVSFGRATGVDGMTHAAFQQKLPSEVSLISERVRDGLYNFSNFKLKLISKGRGKLPRELSIPTIRDRISLRALCDFLLEIFGDDANTRLPQPVIRNLKQAIASGNFDTFIRLDIIDFYPRIRHQQLISRLRTRIRHPEILTAIERALSTPTVEAGSKSSAKNKIGIPQGLAISNPLANIYLSHFDKKISGGRIFFCRYVDDIMILCRAPETQAVLEEITSSLRRLGLSHHDISASSEKSRTGETRSDAFSYLGYNFYGNLVSVRPKSVTKLRESIVSIFTAYHHSKKKNIDFLRWRLNLRITGCIYENRAKGWLFFFSEINDVAILHQLDSFVKNLLRRFGVSLTTKKFIRAYYEINHRKYTNRYIPNFDKTTIPEMRNILASYFNVHDAHVLRDEEIERLFKVKILGEVRDLEEDIGDFGY